MNQEAIVREYFRCYKERDRHTLTRLLSPRLRHVSPWGVHEDREKMLDAIWPHVGRTWAVDIRVLKGAASCVALYTHDGEHTGGAFAEVFRFEGHQIVEIEVFVGE